MKPHKGFIQNWFIVHGSGNPVLEHGLNYRIIGRFVNHPKWPGIRSHTSWIVRRNGREVETEHSRFTLEDGWIDPPELLLRWKALSHNAMYALSRSKYRAAQRTSPDQYSLHLVRPTPQFVPVLRWSSRAFGHSEGCTGTPKVK